MPIKSERMVYHLRVGGLEKVKIGFECFKFGYITLSKFNWHINVSL